MAKNLNYNASGSACHGNNSANCSTYGRLYNWATAMNLASTCNSSSCSNQIQAKHKGICPAGWHIPSNDEWNVLINYAGAIKLKAKSGWNNSNGTDDYGFSALPSGNGDSDGLFYGLGGYNRFWTASEYNSNHALLRYINGNEGNTVGWGAENKRNLLFSVRCVQD
jgi:uncharacterized protein (TIGR02145 family)